jgi:hypothetical protein
MRLRVSAFFRCPGDVRLKLARDAALRGSGFRACPLECLSCPLGNAARGCFASGVATLRGCAHVRRSQTLTRHNFSERERIRENLVGEGPREIERRAPRSETLSARATGEHFSKTRQHARRSCVGTLPWPTPVGSRPRADLVSTFLASCSHRGSSQRSTQSEPDQPTPARDQFKTQPLTANVCLSQTFPRGTT